MTVKESTGQLSLRWDDSRGVKEAVMFRVGTALVLFIKLSSVRPHEKKRPPWNWANLGPPAKILFMQARQLESIL